VLGVATEEEPVGAGLEGALDGGVTTLGGETGTAGAEGSGAAGSGAAGGGGETGGGGGGAGGGVGSVIGAVGTVMVGSVTVGRPTWPSACVLRSAATIPAANSATPPTQVFTLVRTVPLS
jgi:trimeric autotransporter adhesin